MYAAAQTAWIARGFTGWLQALWRRGLAPRKAAGTILARFLASDGWYWVRQLCSDCRALNRLPIGPPSGSASEPKSVPGERARIALQAALLTA
jgi:hypothetical protein